MSAARNVVRLRRRVRRRRRTGSTGPRRGLWNGHGPPHEHQGGCQQCKQRMQQPERCAAPRLVLGRGGVARAHFKIGNFKIPNQICRHSLLVCRQKFAEEQVRMRLRMEKRKNSAIEARDILVGVLTHQSEQLEMTVARAADFAPTPWIPLPARQCQWHCNSPPEFRTLWHSALVRDGPLSTPDCRAHACRSLHQRGARRAFLCRQSRSPEVRCASLTLTTSHHTTFKFGMCTVSPCPRLRAMKFSSKCMPVHSIP